MDGRGAGLSSPTRALRQLLSASPHLLLGPQTCAQLLEASTSAHDDCRELALRLLCQCASAAAAAQDGAPAAALTPQQRAMQLRVCAMLTDTSSLVRRHCCQLLPSFGLLEPSLVRRLVLPAMTSAAPASGAMRQGARATLDAFDDAEAEAGSIVSAPG